MQTMAVVHGEGRKREKGLRLSQLWPGEEWPRRGVN